LSAITECIREFGNGRTLNADYRGLMFGGENTGGEMGSQKEIRCPITIPKIHKMINTFEDITPNIVLISKFQILFSDCYQY
jgi:hypothetical protein